MYMGESNKSNKSLFVTQNKLESNNIQHKKVLIIEGMIKTLGNVSKTCDMLGINRSTFYEYYNNDIEFKGKVDDIKNIALDFVEDKLIGKIKDGDIVAILFYLKTQGKKRGYIERQETELTIQQPVVIDWSEPIQEAEEVKAIEIKEDNKESNEE
jgi:hypothetical protein